jgi:large subunit ribosomal protein L23
VASVRVLNSKGKTKRTRFGVGPKDNIRKAYVRLAEGHDIDFIAEA